MSSVRQIAETLIERGASGDAEHLRWVYHGLHGQTNLDCADWREVEEIVNAQPKHARDEAAPAAAPDNEADAAGTDAEASHEA